LINPTEIDDVSPAINCPEIAKYNPNTLYTIPDYNNTSISNNSEWCNNILSLNKTLDLHGITHTYREFLYQTISQKELNFGISEFEKCFNKTPEMFKPPQLEINKNNKNLIRQNNLKLVGSFHQITHKVYHCNNQGLINNKIINIF
jgi:predicted deacetylase